MKDEIQKIIKGDADDSNETLVKYSHDASIFEIRPQVVIFPKDSADVQAIVKWVNENKNNKEKYGDLSITARCAGTDMSGGAINDSIIFDFTRYMNQLISFAGDSITVQPGMFYRDFEKITLEKGLILPCFTASKTINAMGGMFGNNSAGERTLRYGKTEDYILESKIVFADGVERIVKPIPLTGILQNYGIDKQVYDLITNNSKIIAEAKPNVHKNSAGYYLWNVVHDNMFDLNKLLVGSQGTLGIATEITFKLVRDPKYSKLLVVFLRDMTLVPDLVHKILKHDPQTLESYDDKTFLLVLKYIRSFAKLLGLKDFFKLIFSFGPETIMTLQHGFPKLILLVEFTGDTQAQADELAQKALLELQATKKIGLHLTKDDLEARKYWTIRHEAFNLIRYHLKKRKSKPFVDDVIVRPEMLPEFFPALYKILDEYKKRMTFAVGGHVGDGNMHIYTLVDPADPHLEEMIMEVSDRVYGLVLRLGGSITAEHNDGIIRTPYLEKMYGPKIYDLFKQTKQIFDPQNIFNPGKKVGGTREDIVKKLDMDGSSPHHELHY